MSTQYKVYITPRTDLNIYGTEIDVSDYVLFDGIGKISKSIDAADYNIGIFIYADLTLKCQNLNGYFNEDSDIRSIFKFNRDLSKVRIVFSNTAGDTIVFRGLINEDATKLNTETEQIEFKVLSTDSVLRNTKIGAGVVGSTMTAKDAMVAILSQDQIQSVLTIDSSKIIPGYNFVIDVGTSFDDLSVQDGLNSLLVASNSCMIIDSTLTVNIRTRRVDLTKPILNIYGAYDEFGRQNAISMTDYNTGKQRMFNSRVVNNQIKESAAYSQAYGFKQFVATFDFITTDSVSASIAQALLTEFQFPKAECQVTIATSLKPDLELLDTISLYWPLLIKPIANKFVPVVGVTKIGDTMMPLPYRFGTLEISPNVAWKVIQIDDDANKFVKTLKLRQAGVSQADGYFSTPGSSIIGFAVIGDATIAGTGTVSYNASVVGAALVGNTMVA